MKKRILSILLTLCMVLCLVPTTAFAADCAEDLVDPVIWIHHSSDGGGYYDVLNGTWTAADFFQPGKAPKGAKITAVTPPTSPSIPVSVNVNSDGTLNYFKNNAEGIELKTEGYTVTITSDDYAPISAPLTVRQYLYAGSEEDLWVVLWGYGDTYTYTRRATNPGENGVWSATAREQGIFEIYEETTDTTSEPGKSIYTIKVRALKKGTTYIDILYVSDTTASPEPGIAGGRVKTRSLAVTARDVSITKGEMLPADLVTCTGLLESEGWTDDRDAVLDNALDYRLLDSDGTEVTADEACNTIGSYTIVPTASLKAGWDERYQLYKQDGTLTVEEKIEEQFTLTSDGTYYFDQVYGTMAKGIVTIDGNLYLFDVDTGVMQASITTSEEAMADRVIELVNQERTSRGLQPLLKHDGLMVAAAARAKELSQRYSHTRPDGSECFTILWHLGIDYAYAGENIAMGQKTPEIVMNDWMNSSGHRANILNENFDYIGVGYTMVDGHPYWVQLFTGDFDW